VQRIVRQVWLCLFLACCSTWHAEVVPKPGDLRQTAPTPGTLRIVTRNGATYTLYSASLTRDSVIGETERGKVTTRSAIALSDVARWEQRSTSPGKSVGLAAGVVLGFLVLVGLTAAIFATP
jgi:hypothetical protein